MNFCNLFWAESLSTRPNQALAMSTVKEKCTFVSPSTFDELVEVFMEEIIRLTMENKTKYVGYLTSANP